MCLFISLAVVTPPKIFQGNNINQAMNIVKESNTYNQVKGYALPKGNSYKTRIQAVNAIYDKHVKDGVSNRHIWRAYIYPLFGICERTFYNYLKRDF